MEIRGSEVNGTNRAIALQWSDGCTLHYPFAWLRDNCQCKDCFHPAARMRTFLIKTLDPQIEPVKVEVGDGNQLSVTWPDGHHGDYIPDWLYKRGFTTNEPLQSMAPMDKKPFKYWGSELQDNVPTLQFDEILSDDRALYRWIVHLEETGLCLVQGAPTIPRQVHRLGSRVSQLTPNYCGLTFEVKLKPRPCNPAYDSGDLGLHTDLACKEDLPGMQILHCIAQSSSPGGELIVTDAANVANQMQRDYPDMYKLLTTVPIYHSDIGTEDYEYYVTSKYPCFVLDVNGDLERIHWSGHSRESRQNHLPLALVHPLYQAFCKFEELMMHPDNCIQMKMKPGDIVCIHNYRVMHARTAFSLKVGEERHLEGGYMSWDDLRSKRRVLEAQLQGIDFNNY